MNEPLAAVDPEIAELIVAEERRERDCIRLIPSENYVSRAVLAATGSVLTNKYSVGSSRVDLQACKLEYSIVSPK